MALILSLFPSFLSTYYTALDEKVCAIGSWQPSCLVIFSNFRHQLDLKGCR